MLFIIKIGYSVKRYDFSTNTLTVFRKTLEQRKENQGFSILKESFPTMISNSYRFIIIARHSLFTATLILAHIGNN